MKLLSPIHTMAAFVFRRSRVEREMEEELRSHLENRADDLERQGLSRIQAEQQARIEFGGYQRHKEECREALGIRLLGEFIADARYGMRQLRRSPGLTVVAVLTLALGIGATTAVFSVVDRILFRSLPYPHADRIVSVGFRAPIASGEFMLGTDYLEWRARQKPFQAFTSWGGITACDLTGRTPLRLSCAHVESTFLPAFGITPLLGHNFTRSEDQPRAPKTALLSYGLWQSRFGGARDVVGRVISLDDESVQIIGVLPATFELPTLDHADLLIPQQLDEAAQHRPAPGNVIRTFAVLKPGISITQAHAALEPVFLQSLKWVPPQFQKEVTLGVRSLRDFQVGNLRLALWILFAAVAAVLLIACANVASLLLARAVGRQREFAVRWALGAGRARLMRQNLTESLLLAVAGGATGCLLAAALVRIFVSIAPEGIPRLDQARIDPRVLIFALAASVLCGISFGLVPALQFPRGEWLPGRRGAEFTRHRFRQGLVAGQIAVSLVLLAGASLLLRSLWNLDHEPLGMDVQGVLTVNIDLGSQFHSNAAEQAGFFDRVEERLGALPGVQRLALSDSLPPGGWTHAEMYASIEVEGRPRFESGTGGMVVWRAVTPAYFSALRIPILRGRPFRELDRAPDRHVIIVSSTLARRLFPGRNPLGQNLRLGFQGPWYEVVGVAQDVKNNGLFGRPDPEFYMVRGHAPVDSTRFAGVVMRAQAGMNPAAVAHSIRSVVAQLDPELPVTIETMKERVGTFVVRPRFDASLLGLFAAMGGLLAAIGVFGMTAFLVAQRTHEIGIRLAIGATRAHILWCFVGNAMKVVAIGLSLGLLSAFAACRLLVSLLFGVRTDDPTTYLAALLTLMAIALVGSCLPARRATKVDPMVALRHE
jgi:putative ABC transport system permease protein